MFSYKANFVTGHRDFTVLATDTARSDFWGGDEEAEHVVDLDVDRRGIPARV